MTITHPIQTILSRSDGKLFFIVVKNMILALKTTDNKNYSICGKWVDDLDRTPFLKQNVLKEQARQIAANEEAGISKKIKKNDGASSPASIIKKEAKVPVPGSGAPQIYLQIRNLALSRDETKLYACTDSDKAIVVFKIDLTTNENCLELVKRQPYPKRPNAITSTLDSKSIVMADKFGDVYDMPLEGDVVDNVEELNPILGHVSMLTNVLASQDSNGKNYIITSDRDEHIKISHYPQTFIVNKWLFGHEEFVSSLVIPDYKTNLLFSAGGDHSIFSWDWEKGTLLDKFEYSQTIKPYLTDRHLAPERFQNETNDSIEYAVVNITTFKNLPYLAFFVEATPLLIILKVQNDGKLSFFQDIKMSNNIISLSSVYTTKNIPTFAVTLDATEQAGMPTLVELAEFDEANSRFIISKDVCGPLNNFIIDTLKDDKIAQVEKSSIFPLYTVINLKKHGEHYS
ncbi:hypothetical protein TBLA_0A04150 [Henningerozyma blattae CBS 6284]|uniref:Uncharacterized protein n=1 Tax=Henningerozyma blattae (strain ATCC 34711 / CBS 6284 / DSM 70876 / NBRC 10599 / NRRL Y-10934 / UCD 77-7) TaxID=1071380 RepID=I2GVQ9_HENB6|nr:hypothetical protein TBLA_0A04150 [Tetrapisispora blattae CBS 6284]CCH58211.1 hypothetical protein TBLA_0A04150 [Tetrapisispora blattae CBS 6284]